MISSLLKKVFGSRNERLLKEYRQVVRQINALEEKFTTLSDEELRAQTEAFKLRVQGGESLDHLLPEAFAVCREASKRILNMRHFDVQLVGGMALHYGKIAEMRTGEGKTLVATLPTYLNALSGNGVHVITVNDYLAKRDAEWMARLYNFLGLSVGINLPNMQKDKKREAYAADITYGTNNEYGFDYLRDNMEYETADRVQRKLNYALIDEVDSILIDEARTPLIISGQAEDNVEMYLAMNQIAPQLKKQDKEDGTDGDFWVDEKAHQVTLTESGHERVEQILTEAGLLRAGDSLYSPVNIGLMHHLYAALRAHSLYHIDQHYVVQDGEVVIVDEFTGRLMTGRRWSEGLHQAVEAKEGVKIQKENQTLASITFQNYFRMYAKLGGMTGTADTEAYEFQSIYSLETVVIPTHRPVSRKDLQDQVYRTKAEKHQAIANEIKKCTEAGQPVLVGTTSIENSEELSLLLNQAGLAHNVLNAKQHAREAEIIAQAGRPSQITIATNMAGRGTDIVLGGSVEKQIQLVEENPALSEAEKHSKIAQLQNEWQGLHEKVLAAGGLHIIGTERHESRRVDNQLRGRSGRQGDVGSSRFFLSLEDPLLRIFASDKVAAIMDRLKMPEGEAIEHVWVTRSIENAQRKVEGRNFDVRKQLLEFDDVSNEQRQIIYRERNHVLDSQEVSETVASMRHDVLREQIALHIPAESMEEQWDVEGLERFLLGEFQLSLPISVWLAEDKKLDSEKIAEKIILESDRIYDAKTQQVGLETMQQFERAILLQVIDKHWREHLSALDHLRQGIHLRSYGQKNPKQEYKREAFELFSGMLDQIKAEVCNIVVKVQINSESDVEEMQPDEPLDVQYQHANFEQAIEEEEVLATATEEIPAATSVTPMLRVGEKIARNDPCPCGSGLKYKQCHGKLS